MGNDPGKPLNAPGETSRVVIDITGPFKEDDAKQFKNELMTLLGKYKAKWGDHKLPVKN